MVNRGQSLHFNPARNLGDRHEVVMSPSRDVTLLCTRHATRAATSKDASNIH